MNYNNAKSLLSLALLQSLTLRETINKNPEKADTIIEAVEEIVKDVKKSLPKKRTSKNKPAIIKEEEMVSDEEINSMIKQIENEEKITKQEKKYFKMVEKVMEKDLGEIDEC